MEITFQCRKTPDGYLEKLRDFYNARDYLEWAAFHPGGKGWSVIPQSGHYANNGLPAQCEQFMKDLSKDGAKITRIFFSPQGGFSVHNDRGSYLKHSIPDDCNNAMWELNKKGKIVCLAFHPQGGWIVVNEKGDRDHGGNIPSGCLQDVEKLSQDQKKVVCIAFPPQGGDSWTVINDHGSYFSRSPPEEAYMYMGYFNQVCGPNQFVNYDTDGTGWTVAAKVTNHESATDGSKTVKILDVYQNIQEVLDDSCVGYSCTIGKSILGSFSWGQARTNADSPAQQFLPSTKINLASCAKVLTALAAIRLLAIKGISLDDNIGNHLPDFWTRDMSPAAKAITFRMLLSHHSGIKDKGWNETYDNLKDFFTSLNDKTSPDIWNPDGKKVYSNWNFAIFRVLLPVIDGFSDWSWDFQWPLAHHYVKIVQQHVFERVGVTGVDTEPPTSGSQASKYAYAYTFPGTERGIIHDQGTKVAGGGGWWATVEDIAQVLNSLNQNDGRILTSEQLRDMTGNAMFPIQNPPNAPFPEDPDPNHPTNPFARLGWDTTENAGGIRWIQKNGGLAGITTSIALFGGGIFGALLVNSNIAAPGAEVGWQFCNKCHVLASTRTSNIGRCPAGDVHDHKGSWTFCIPFNATPANSQKGWRWCKQCQAMTFAGGSKIGRCSQTGSNHDHGGSGEYSLVENLSSVPPFCQNQWAWCSKCQVLAWKGNGSGVCAEGGVHDHTGSGDYVLRRTAGADEVLRDAYVRAMK